MREGEKEGERVKGRRAFACVYIYIFPDCSRRIYVMHEISGSESASAVAVILRGCAPAAVNLENYSRSRRTRRARGGGGGRYAALWIPKGQ